ncbi:cytochrome C [Methylobacterium sp. Leaf469]|uniref:cytochrome c1 n=1 Tax=unclassified Methylobacterium TaxID=2615210 RepID=UPI000701313D|nr:MULTISPECIES: cytochrome c1 [unclassified Methylobacterium]KQO55341.1 cytochrome C [Methylobacterium sp. Leaf87]KQT86761.1 cytochrome C [Methylobacterium sp. Leaf469]USU32618.1 cytochrome c1 [Methylobacterium sp. OTU13CASTA1]
MKTTRLLAATLVAATLGITMASAEEEHGAPQPPRQTWSFAGMFGRFDQAQLQRGFQVYREVCSSCHGMSLVRFRNLAEPGGPGFSASQVKALAAEYKVKEQNDSGEDAERPARAADAFPSPFPNEKAAAAANGGKAPPDFSVLAKARTFERGFPKFLTDALPVVGYTEHGVDYIHAVLDGYEDPPAGKEVPAGTYYNKYYPGHLIAMPKPLSDGQVTYAKTDKGEPVVPETVSQYATDVAAFMAWTAEPHMMARKALGLRVILFLIVLSGLLYYVKKKIWAKVGGEVHGLQPELHKTY